jgi:hypothetical protein
MSTEQRAAYILRIEQYMTAMDAETRALALEIIRRLS